ncbi:MAG: hypothetical protein M3167_06200 [Acidobacteriota bacterium]|nr:hypothetical protein [Acidobacteriota bacterium]MDQ6892256.1 hypothetical protein [Acidobacteriota bacterium]
MLAEDFDPDPVEKQSDDREVEERAKAIFAAERRTPLDTWESAPMYVRNLYRDAALKERRKRSQP